MKLQIFLLAAAAAVAPSQAILGATEVCRKSTNEIVSARKVLLMSSLLNSIKVDLSDYPYLASVGTTNTPHTCGGALLNEYTVLTAAQCCFLR